MLNTIEQRFSNWLQSGKQFNIKANDSKEWFIWNWKKPFGSSRDILKIMWLDMKGEYNHE